MTELSGGIVPAAIKTAVNYDTTRQARADPDIKQIPNVGVLRLAVPDFGQCSTTRGVINDHGQSGRLSQQLDHRHVAPGKNYRNQKFAAIAINQAGKTDA